MRGRILILGGDGYLGWPTAMRFALSGWSVHVVDNYARRHAAQKYDLKPLVETPRLERRCAIFSQATNATIAVSIFDVTDFERLSRLMLAFQPDVVVHFAEQPSAPYSMRDVETARYTLTNNIGTTFNVVWAILQNCPNCHLIKLGTMGEYGTPDIDIEEGWITINHKGRSDRFLFPRQGGSLYHTTKIMDTDLIHFYVRTYGLKATDLMQGPVYGVHTEETRLADGLLTNFHYDEMFGTVINRFIVQAAAGIPLTVYGNGRQRRGFINIVDTIRCVEIAADNPPEAGKFRVVNQFTETFSVMELAERVSEAAEGLGLEPEIRRIPNPRAEMQEHYFNPASGFFIERGLEPCRLSGPVLTEMLALALEHRSRIDTRRIHPTIDWSPRTTRTRDDDRETLVGAAE